MADFSQIFRYDNAGWVKVVIFPMSGNNTFERSCFADYLPQCSYGKKFDLIF